MHPLDQPLPSREFGLSMGLTIGGYLFGMEDLHYGYWPEGLEIHPRNLPKAQEHYSRFVLGRIPSEVRAVLDVGCGAGNIAAGLLNRGYSVECLSPNPHLNQVVRERLGGQVQVHDVRFQDHEIRRKFDLVLFSESLLFIHPLDVALRLAADRLESGGYVLISDLFRTTGELDRGPIGGGHYQSNLEEVLAAQRWEVLEDHDITAEVARTFDMLEQGYRALRPAYDLVLSQLKAKYPFWAKLLLWKFGAKLDRAEKKHFSGQRDGESFKKYKRYRVVLLRKPEPAG